MSDKKLKPIPTEYNGYSFRSKLEAQWAYFFDLCKIKYVYEPEGYELPNGTWYLPDFYLPDYEMHVEVKANTEQGRKEILEKTAQSVVWGGPIKKIMILSSIPEPVCKDGGLPHFPYFRWGCRGVVAAWCFFFEGEGIELAESSSPYPSPDIANNIDYVSDSKFNNRSCRWVPFIFGDEPFVSSKTKELLYELIKEYNLDIKDVDVMVERKIDMTEDYIYMQTHGNNMVFDAFGLARKARFDHGEQPIIRELISKNKYKEEAS